MSIGTGRVVQTIYRYIYMLKCTYIVHGKTLYISMTNNDSFKKPTYSVMRVNFAGFISRLVEHRFV